MKVKLSIIFITAVIFCSKPLQAQDFKGIATVGINASQIDGDYLSGYHKFGLMVGVGVERKLYKRWSVSLGLEFMEKGSRTSYKDSSIYFKWKLQYLDLPLLFSFKAHQRFRFQLGLTPSILVNEKVDNGNGYYKPAFKDDLFHALISPGVEFSFAENLSLLLRYQYSITPFNSGVSYTVPKFHNLISVGLRYYFIGKHIEQ